MHISFSCVQEDVPGEKWKALFHRTWPHYQQWLQRWGLRKGYLTSYGRLQRHMPELVPIYDQLVTLVGGGDTEARFLSMYCPPAYLAGCSQIAWIHNSPSLIRNYDYSFKMFEGTLWYSHWLQPVMGVSDCCWGLLDGINASGLAASLTFGGRKVVGKGFGIPLVIRYLLETCRSVPEAQRVLMRIPVHMAYNVTLIDTSGAYTTLYLSPDRAPVVVNTPVATNHQEEVEWTDYALLTGTIERKQLLENLHYSPGETEASVLRQFLLPPLYNTQFEKSFGTLYTAQYRVEQGEVSLFWPGTSIRQDFTRFTETAFTPSSPILPYP